MTKFSEDIFNNMVGISLGIGSLLDYCTIISMTMYEVVVHNPLCYCKTFSNPRLMICKREGFL